MNTKAIHQVQIDVETKFVKPFMAALGKLKTTVSLENNGEYQYGKCATGYNLLSYTGELNADGIDEWAYRVKAGAGFVGAVDEKQEAQKEINVDKSVPDDTAINFQNLAYDAKQVETPVVKFTSEKNDKGNLIAANPATAKVYAEMDYYGMAKARDTRSRNKREGKYAGRYKATFKNGKRSNWRVGPKGEYDTLKETATFKKQVGL